VKISFRHGSIIKLIARSVLFNNDQFRTNSFCIMTY